MKTRPILFKGAMVRALLAGTKTQTRRLVNPQPSGQFFPCVGNYSPSRIAADGELYPGVELYGASDENEDYPSRLGKPGDRLWVKETHRWHLCMGEGSEQLHYRADGDSCKNDGTTIKPWTPSIFMPKAASRLTLEIVSVRCERLNAITEADALAEGIRYDAHLEGFCYDEEARGFHCTSAVRAYENLWNAINGECAWSQNPWVWVIEFRRVPQGGRA